MDHQILTQAHGKKAMLKYMHLLSKSPVACEKFVRGGGAAVCFDLMQEEAQRKDVMFVLRKMLQGSNPSVRTELTTQMEEQVRPQRCSWPTGRVPSPAPLLCVGSSGPSAEYACMRAHCVAWQGFITAIFEILKNKRDPVPLKVAAVEVIKAMQEDEDEATAEAVKASVDRYPEVRAPTLYPAT